MRPILASAVLLSALVTPALADARGGILVLKLEHEGLAPDVVEALEDGLRAGVRRAKRGKLLSAPALDFSGMQLAAGCLDDGPECLANMGRPLGATRVVRAQLSGDQARGKLTITVVMVRGQKRKIYEATLTEIGADTRTEVAWHASKALGAKPPPLQGGIALLMGSSIGTLEGAEIFLDDKKVPRSALESLSPGNHRLEVHQRGFDTFIWIGDVKPGRQTEVRVELKPTQVTAATPPPEPPPPMVETPPVTPPPRAAPPPPVTTVVTTPDDPQPIFYTFFVGAAAVLAAGTGTVFAVMAQESLNSLEAMEEEHGNAVYSSCLLDKPDTPLCNDLNDLEDRRRLGQVGSAAAFITAGALGAAAITVFFIEWTLDDEPEMDVAFGIAPTDGGASAGMSLAF